MVMLTLRETAAELRLGSTKTWQLAATGAIPTVRFGRRVLVTRADLDQFIADHREGGDGAATGSTPAAARGGHGNGRRARA
jgi:excisionase family DNA binding protein